MSHLVPSFPSHKRECNVETDDEEEALTVQSDSIVAERNANIAAVAGRGTAAVAPSHVDVREEYTPADGVRHDLSPELAALFNMVTPMKIVMDACSLVVYKYTPDIEGVRVCMKENDLDETLAKDVIFGVILTFLASAGAVPVNRTGEVPKMPADFAPPANSILNELVMEKVKVGAKTMMLVALHMISRGLGHDTARWYEPFCAVFGRFVSQKRFIELANGIQSTTALNDYAKVVTLGELSGENNVLQDRLARQATPSLIRKALMAVSGSNLLRYVNPTVVNEYRSFHEAGLAAQIAAGPLKIYCIGTINPLVTKNIPPETTISMLAPIKAPYDSRTIKQAKIILETFDIPHGKWYQAEKAMSSQDFHDAIFRIHARALKNAQRVHLENIAKKAAEKIGQSESDTGNDN